MASNGSRGGLLTAGGVLSIVAGIPQIICSGVLIVEFLFPYRYFFGRLIEVVFLPRLPNAWRTDILWGSDPFLENWSYIPIRWAIVGGCIGILGIVAIVGGISAIRRKRFGLSLAGAICALPSGIWGILGILAVIFVALSKKEFGAKS